MRIDEMHNTTVFGLEESANRMVDRLSASRTQRQARHAYGVTELFRDRDELRGVYAPADLVEEFTRWCA